MEYKIVIVNPEMQSNNGHNYAWNKYFESTFIKNNIKYNFIFNKDIHENFLQEFKNSYALLTNMMHKAPFFKIVEEPCEKYISQALQIQKELENLEISVTPRTLFFCHTANPATILGMLYWCAGLPRHQQPALLFHFHFSFLPLEEWAVEIFSLIKRQLSFVPRAFFCSVVPYIISFLTKNLQIEIEELPLFLSPPPTNILSTQKIFGFMGSGRLDQGITFIPNLIENYIERQGKSHFIIQFGRIQKSHPQVKEAYKRVTELAQKYPEQVNFVSQYLSRNEYYAIMQKLNLIIMPYDPVIFHPARPSQILCEAIYMNIPALVCEGSSLAAEVSHVNNGSIIIKNCNIENLCNALFHFDATAKERLSLAEIAGKKYREKNNINLIEFLLEFCNIQKARKHISLGGSFTNEKFERHNMPLTFPCNTHKLFATLLENFKKFKYKILFNRKIIYEYNFLKYSGLFIYTYYIYQNQDIQKSAFPALLHFIIHGWKEGRRPNPYFDPRYYINMYPDVAQENINPLIHYIKYGWKEGRNPSKEFNTVQYLNMHKDIYISNINPLKYYLQYSIYEYCK